ncbi:MAG: EamA family transporter, partial [Clostridia bacterium]|nr:EamA family transporter [Clostridia bacterium]
SIGNLSKVVAVDKSSTFLTILLALIFFHEPFHWLTGLGIAVMIVGTALMLEKGDAKKGERGWLFYAAGSAVFAALQSILGKVGVQDMDSTLATALRTVVVLVFAWAIVLVKKEGGDWKKMTRRDAVLLVLSGITTGASWLCYYRALQTGRASVVVPIDKCSMLFAVALSAIFLKEKQTRRSLLALALVVAGTFMIALA